MRKTTKFWESRGRMVDKIRLLLVEDEADDCNRFVEYVGGVEELEFIGATDSAEQAVEMVGELLPDVIVMDLELSEGDGIDAIFRIRQMSLPFDPYIIVTTNTTSQPTLQMVRDNGADFVVTKQTRGYGPKQVVNVILRTKKYLRKKAEGEKIISQPVVEVISPDARRERLARRIKTEMSYISLMPGKHGYRLLVDAVLMVLDHPNDILMVTKDIYPALAKKYSITSKNVERAIRSAIESAWNHAGIEALELHCPELVNANQDKPTNKEFIYYLADKIRSSQIV